MGRPPNVLDSLESLALTATSDAQLSDIWEGEETFVEKGFGTRTLLVPFIRVYRVWGLGYRELGIYGP